MKIVEILVTIIGIVWLLPLIGVDQLGVIGDWIVVVAVLVIGIGKLIGKI